MRLMAPAVPCALAMFLAASGEGPAAVGEESGPALERAAAEIDSLAPRHDGGASPESITLGDRLRRVLAQVAGIARAGGADADQALRLLATTAARRERGAAMEAVRALLDLDSGEAMRSLIRSLGTMDLAVRRRGLDAILARGGSPAGAAKELLAALEEETDSEAAAALVRIAGSLGTLESARAILRAAGEGTLREGDDRRSELRSAAVESLRACTAPAVADWLSGPAFREAPLEPGAAARLALLARVAAARKSDLARPALENLVRGPHEHAAVEALEAIAALGAAGSRPLLEAAARGEQSSVVAVRAAALLAEVDGDAGREALLVLTRHPAWAYRSASARALGTCAPSDAAFRRAIQLLEDPNREVRRAAYAALRAFRRKESVAEALRLLAPLRARDPGLAVEYLEWASGRKLGRDRAAWGRWWESASGTFEFPPALLPPSRG